MLATAQCCNAIFDDREVRPGHGRARFAADEPVIPEISVRQNGCTRQGYFPYRACENGNLAICSAALWGQAAQPKSNRTNNRVQETAMGLQQAKLESLPFVTGELNYLAPTPGKPRTYAFDPPPGEPRSTALPESHQVPIFDGRLIANNLSLDREGFALVRHPTIVRNFYDDKEVRNVYYSAA